MSPTRRRLPSLPAGFGLALLAVLLAAGLFAPRPVHGATFTVNIGGDTSDGSCDPFNFMGRECTLREAIEEANANPGRDTIDFGGFFSAGPQLTITVSAAGLPLITDSVTIDGATAAAGRVNIDGVNTGSGVDGLRLNANGNRIRGLAIYNFDGSTLESDGIHINGDDNFIENNYIGVDAGGTASGLGNGVGIRINGCPSLGGSGDDNAVGGTTASKRNVIAGSDTYGIWIRCEANNNLVQGNYIGTNAAGSAALPNLYGVQMHGGTGNVTGGTTGTTPGGPCTGACNVISGNLRGIRIDAASNQSVVGNFIGTNAAGTSAVPNTILGITVQGNNNTIGGTSAVARNVISGNVEDGVRVHGDNNVLIGNYIGLNAAGTGPVPNGTGISLGHPDDPGRDALANTVGGLTPGERNVVSGNAGAGVAVHGRAEQNMLIGNFIGTNPAGTAAIPNGNGVYVAQPSNTIGGTEGVSPGGPCTGACNLISGNQGAGVHIDFQSGNRIYANHIGLNIDGGPLANGTGVLVDNAAGNFIGGAAAAEANVIAANSTGVQIAGLEASGNMVQGNLIGTGAAGTAAMGNSFFGVRLDAGAHDNTIGGAAAGTGNIISANGTGVRIGDNTTTANLIQGNFIGTNAAGAEDLGNLNEGVYISNAAGNSIGGTEDGAGNIIAHNGADNPDAAGVRVQDSDALRNAILGNSIHTNAALGIRLDNSANEDQAAPMLATAVNGSTHIQGTLNSTVNTTFRIEFFANSACDPSGFGEGETFIGFADVTTDASGNAAIDVTFPTTVGAGGVITATATDLDGNTSEFSQCVTVTGPATPTATPTPTPPPSPTPTPTPSPTPTATPPGQTPSPTPTRSPTPTATPPGQTPSRTPTPTATPPGQTPTPTPTATATGAPTATTTPTPTATTSATASPPPGERLWGDIDCSGGVGIGDAQKIARDLIGLPITQAGVCPPVGSEVSFGGEQRLWGDTDCGGAVGIGDAQKIARDLIDLPISQEPGCPQVGEVG